VTPGELEIIRSGEIPLGIGGGHGHGELGVGWSPDG